MTQLATPPPATVPRSRGMTVEQFLREPDQENYELVDGQRVERQTSYESALIGGKFFRFFDEYADDHGGHANAADADFRCFGDRKRNCRRPDATYIVPGRLDAPPKGPCEIPQDVAVEVISPNDNASLLDDKRLLYLREGVRCVLIAHPVSRTVDVYYADRAEVLLDMDTLSLPEIMPEFELPVAKVFPPKPAA